MERRGPRQGDAMIPETGRRLRRRGFWIGWSSGGRSLSAVGGNCRGFRMRYSSVGATTSLPKAVRPHTGQGGFSGGYNSSEYWVTRWFPSRAGIDGC